MKDKIIDAFDKQDAIVDEALDAVKEWWWIIAGLIILEIFAFVVDSILGVALSYVCILLIIQYTNRKYISKVDRGLGWMKGMQETLHILKEMADEKEEEEELRKQS